MPDDVKPAGARSAWPDLSNDGIDTANLKDSDNDGIPDIWETAHNLDSNDASDGNAVTLSDEGYTNLEIYLNDLVKNDTQNQSYN